MIGGGGRYTQDRRDTREQGKGADGVKEGSSDILVMVFTLLSFSRSVFISIRLTTGVRFTVCGPVPCTYNTEDEI